MSDHIQRWFGVAGAAAHMLALLALLAVSACRDEDAASRFAPVCEIERSGRDVRGDWMLDGEGERSGCDDEQLNGPLKLSTKLPIEVDSTVIDGGLTECMDDSLQVADRFVCRILGADHILEARLSSDQKDLKFEAASTHGACVSFTLTETLHGEFEGDKQVIHFEGSAREDGEIRGRFTGEGPEQCVLSGTITVTVN